MVASSRKRSSLLDTGVIYCGDNLDQLKKLPDACIGLIYIALCVEHFPRTPAERIDLDVIITTRLRYCALPSIRTRITFHSYRRLEHGHRTQSVCVENNQHHLL